MMRLARSIKNLEYQVAIGYAAVLLAVVVLSVRNPINSISQSLKIAKNVYSGKIEICFPKTT